MADTRTAQVAAAAGVAAGTGAAQLGLAYGLSVVVWPTAADTGDTVWLSSLGWATWIAAGSTVLGAVTAAWLRSTSTTSPQPKVGGPWRFVLSVAAAIGALLTVLLIAVPARTAVRADNYAPEMIAGGYAIVGVLIGLVLAYWAVVSRPVAANLIVTAGWLWTLAVAAIAHGLITNRPTTGTYLGGWPLVGPEFRLGTVYWPGALLTLVAALLIGALAVWPAVRRGDHGIGAAASGAVGPLLVAASFFVLVPKLTSALGELQSAYLIAPYAVLAGLAGSAAVVALGQRSARRAAARPVAPARVTASGDSTSGDKPSATRAPADRPPVDTAPADESPADDAPRRGLFGRRKPSGESATSESATASAGNTESGRPARVTGRARLPKARRGSADADSTPTGDLRPPADPWAGKDTGTAKGSAPVKPPGDPAPAQRPARSTVTPPPATPTVAQINPATDGAAPAKTGDSAPTAAARKAVPAATSAPTRGVSARTTSPAPAKAAPAKTAAAKTASPKATPARTVTAKTADNEAAPAKPAPAKAAPATATKAAPMSPLTGKALVTDPATPTTDAADTDATRTDATRTDATRTDATRIDAVATDVNTTEVAASTTANTTASAPLWVDDAESTSENTDGKGRFRRFGRRSGTDQD